MELKWSVPQYRDKLLHHLGGLHVAMNFTEAIGDPEDSFGLAEVWVKRHTTKLSGLTS